MHVSWHRRAWQRGDRVVVAIGADKGKHGTVRAYASQNNWLVELDNEQPPKQFKGGGLDPE